MFQRFNNTIFMLCYHSLSCGAELAQKNALKHAKTGNFPRVMDDALLTVLFAFSEVSMDITFPLINLVCPLIQN